MTNIKSFLVSAPGQFDELYSEIEQIFCPTRRFPENVFRAKYAKWKFFDFNWALAPEFWQALQSTSRVFGDGHIRFCLIDPDAQSYRCKFGHFGMWEVNPAYEPEVYSGVMHADPGNSPADAFQHIGSVVCWWGSSGRWGFWGERDLGIVVGGVSDSQSSNWFEMKQVVNSPQIALDDIISLEFQNRIIPPEFCEKFVSSYGLLP